MDEIQLQHERAVAENFIRWYNQQHGTNFTFHGRPEEAPDQAFRDGENELQVEVADAYYDKADAMLKWKTARGAPDAPSSWSGSNFDDRLVESINRVIEEKCAKDYGRNCAFVVNVYPNLTTAGEMEAMLPEIRVPDGHRFTGVYLTGDFPHATGDIGGYRCWQLA